MNQINNFVWYWKKVSLLYFFNLAHYKEASFYPLKMKKNILATKSYLKGKYKKPDNLHMRTQTLILNLDNVWIQMFWLYFQLTLDIPQVFHRSGCKNQKFNHDKYLLWRQTLGKSQIVDNADLRILQVYNTHLLCFYVDSLWIYLIPLQAKQVGR